MYSPLTMQEAYSTVAGMLKKYDTGMNIDWGTFCNLSYRALISIMSKTTPFKQWAYRNEITLSGSDGTYLLPTDFIRMIRVSVRDAVGAVTDARYVDVREWYSVTGDEYNMWNIGIQSNPVYTLWGTTDPTEPHTLGFRVYPIPTQNSVTITFYCAPIKTELMTDFVGVLADYESLYLTELVIRLMNIYGLTSKAEYLEAELQQQVNVIAMANMELDKTEKVRQDIALDPPKEGDYIPDNWYQFNLINKLYGFMKQ